MSRIKVDLDRVNNSPTLQQYSRGKAGKTVRCGHTRQRAFRRADGVAENLFLLASVLRDSRARCRGLCLASLDLFDKVSHDSISSAMRRVELSAPFVYFVQRMYRNSGTFIQVGSQSSWALVVQRGVRQEDPLSPLLFNLVIDLGLQAIPDTVGCSLGEARVSVLAFTDDVILVAETSTGLQFALTFFVDKLGEAVNEAKPGKVCDPYHVAVRESCKG